MGVFRGLTWYLDYSGNGAWGTVIGHTHLALLGDIPVTDNWSEASVVTSIQSVCAHPIMKKNSIFQTPIVTRPAYAISSVNIPVKNGQSNGIEIFECEPLREK